MKKQAVLDAVREKANPSVDKVVAGTADDHDVFPALLWSLAENANEMDLALKQFGQVQSAKLTDLGLRLDKQTNELRGELKKIEDVSREGQIALRSNIEGQSGLIVETKESIEERINEVSTVQAQIQTSLKLQTEQMAESIALQTRLLKKTNLLLLVSGILTCITVSVLILLILPLVRG